MTLEPTKYYMHPSTGSVALGEEWINDQIEHGFPIKDLADLVEVWWNSAGAWEEIE
jgi:hypothetical protein